MSGFIQRENTSELVQESVFIVDIWLGGVCGGVFAKVNNLTVPAQFI